MLQRHDESAVEPTSIDIQPSAIVLGPTPPGQGWPHFYGDMSISIRGSQESPRCASRRDLDLSLNNINPVSY